MRTRSIFCSVALIALFCAAPVLADPVNITLYDSQGQQLTGASVLLERAQGGGGKFEGQASYLIDLQPGEKVTFHASDPNRDWVPATYIAPPVLEQDVDLTLVYRTLDDTCNGAEAIDLSGGVAVVAGDTTGAVLDPAAGTFCGTTINTGGLWYTVVGTGNIITASTCNDAAYDTKISVFCQDCDTGLTCITGNDDGVGCAAFSSEISWCSQAGATYRILVHGFNGSQGAFNLTVTDGDVCASTDDCLPPPPPIPTGACCFDNCNIGLDGATPSVFEACLETSCEDISEADCAAAGGAFQGNDVPCVTSTGVVQSYTSSPAAAIPDNDAAGLKDVLSVPDDFVIADLTATLDITHTWVGDLVVILTSPDGTQVGLWNGQCGSADNLNGTFDDAGTSTLCVDLTTPGGGFVPPLGGGAMADFDAENASGGWSLLVVDTYTADTGSLNSWTLNFELGESPCSPACAPGGTTGGGDEDEDEDADDGIDPNVLTGLGQIGAGDTAADEGLILLQQRPNTDSQATTTGARDRIRDRTARKPLR